MSALRSGGIVDEACYPYQSGRLAVDYPSSGACGQATSRALRIEGYQTVNASGLKRALLSGPAVTTFTVYEDFLYYRGGVYQHTSGRSVGGHAVLVVGYDDTLGA